jgi:uncharacterized repeat protein (TIGR01451 family)
MSTWPKLAFVRAVVCVAGLACSATLGSAAPCDFWVATTGNNGNSGSNASPWATLSFAVTAVPDTNPGKTVCAKDGTYNGRMSINRRFNNMTTFRAENQYKVKLQADDTVLYSFGGKNVTIEGFEMTHSGASTNYVVQIQMDDDIPGDFSKRAENIVLRNNILHDSLNNDIIKANNGAHLLTFEGNVFYNQQGTDQHIDINSVEDVTVQDNIFFNDFAGSGRAAEINTTAAFIVVKDSGGAGDGFLGVKRVNIRRNVFLNWQGNNDNNWILNGDNDVDPAQSYYESEDVTMENNLFIGNALNDMRSGMGVKGCHNITFRNNTMVGDQPGCSYAMRLNQESEDKQNLNIFFYNNIWADYTGTMGAGCSGGNDFSDGDPTETSNAVLDRNVYWNNGVAIPAGDVLSPLVNDATRIVSNPLLPTNQAGIVLPRWNGTTSLSGSTNIRQEFVRLVNTYGAIPVGSPAVNAANAGHAPADDILGNPRVTPDIGAFEIVSTVSNISISDVTVTEGDAGTVAANFTVTLSAANAQNVTVQYATADNTAVAPGDYTAVGLTTLTFTPGQVSKIVTVNVAGDLVDEVNETFFVNLSNASASGNITDAQGIGTITDDDPKSNLGVTKSDGVATASPGQVLVFTIVVSNAGPVDAIAATVTDTIPSGLTGATWTCVAAGGVSSCGAANGAGNIAETIDVAVGGTVTYTLTATVAPTPTSVLNTVTVGVAPGYLDPNTANNTATDADLLICDPGATTLVPDGRTVTNSLGAGASQGYLIPVHILSSYSIQATNDLGGTGGPTVTIFTGDEGCAATSNLVQPNTAAIEPKVAASTTRRSFTATPTDPNYRVKITNGGGSTLNYSLRMAETTLYSPAWSTNQTFDTYYSFQNTTSAVITGTLTMRDTTGAVVKSQPVTVQPGRTTSFNTSVQSMGVARTKTGTAQLSHNGPPGAILAQCNIANFTTTPAYVQSVKFTTVRE